MFKKLTIILLASILTISTLVGCSNSSTTSSNNKAKLSVWIYGWEKEASKLYQSDAVEWGKSHNADLTIIGVSVDTYTQKMQMTLASGTNPDIAFAGVGVLTNQLAAKGKLLALDSYGVSKYQDKFYPSVWDSWKYNGKTYGLSATTNNTALFYNKAMFDKAGIKYPDANWTWDDLRNAAKKLTNPTKKTYGIDLGTGSIGNGEWTLFTWIPFLIQNNANFLTDDKTKSAFSSPQGVEALEFWNTLVNKDKSSPKQSPSAGVDRFASQQVAMSINGPWSIENWIKDPNLKDNLGVTFLPKKVNSATVIGGEGLVIFKNTKYPQQAYDYIEHLTTNDNFVQKFYKTWFCVSPLVKYANFYDYDTKLGPFMKVFSDNMKVAKSRQWVPAWPQIQDRVGRAIGETISNNVPAKDALDKAAVDVDKILASDANK